ncbi:DUF1697 domain-containing protein [Microbacterium kunmingense]|uniref:DUF1697 domain-containing protein n=1 Tax=Microbacterium kunmingense TaxID=2915939 RepID=UPI00249E2290|nr:DUF1697 domain-containing protein [Microbacterium kunmingense]
MWTRNEYAFDGKVSIRHRRGREGRGPSPWRKWSWSCGESDHLRHLDQTERPRTGSIGYNERVPTYLAFLRAVNLGAKRVFPKDDIRRVVEGVGFTAVETYINTGNVRFRTSMRSRARIESALEAAFAAPIGASMFRRSCSRRRSAAVWQRMSPSSRPRTRGSHATTSTC